MSGSRSKSQPQAAVVQEQLTHEVTPVSSIPTHGDLSAILAPQCDCCSLSSACTVQQATGELNNPTKEAAFFNPCIHVDPPGSIPQVYCVSFMM